MKLKNLIIIIAVALLIGLLAWYKIRSTRAAEQKNKSITSLKNTAPVVDVSVVSTQKLDNQLMSSGTVIANNEVDLYSETSGKITHILFKEGGRVTKGELLVKIY